MSALIALAGGIGLGLISFGQLWRTVRHITLQPRHRGRIVVSQMGRLLLLSLGFFAMCKAGPTAIVCGLCGVLVARSYLLLTVGKIYSNA